MYTRLTQYIASALSNPFQFHRIFRFVIPGQSLDFPRFVQAFSFAQDNSWIAHMTDVEFRSPDEDHTCGATRGTRETGGCLRPLAHVIPHVVVTGQKAFANGRENHLIIRGIRRPEIILFVNMLTEMLTSEFGRFFSAVPVENAKVSQGYRTFLIRRIHPLQSYCIRIFCNTQRWECGWRKLEMFLPMYLRPPWLLFVVMRRLTWTHSFVLVTGVSVDMDLDGGCGVGMTASIKVVSFTFLCSWLSSSSSRKSLKATESLFFVPSNWTENVNLVFSLLWCIYRMLTHSMSTVNTLSSSTIGSLPPTNQINRLCPSLWRVLSNALLNVSHWTTDSGNSCWERRETRTVRIFLSNRSTSLFLCSRSIVIFRSVEIRFVRSTQMSSSASIGDQDELHARRKLEQKRRFQQTQGKAPTDVDSLMQSMFTDLKLPNKGSMISQVKDATISSETKKTNDILDFSIIPLIHRRRRMQRLLVLQIGRRSHSTMN